jgi:hypothetical protein
LKQAPLPVARTVSAPIPIVGKRFTPAEFRQYVETLDFSSWRPQFVVLHNTSAPRLSQWHDKPGEQRMQDLAYYYGTEQGWRGGPHLIIDDDGIWVFNPLNRSGVHSPSWNAISWGVDMVGEYSEEPFNEKVRDNTVEAIATLDSSVKIDAATLHFHKDDPRTTHKDCPGSHVDKVDLIQRIKAAMARKP